MMTGKPGWTYERTMQLIDLWQDHCSAGDIARIMKHVTRSMVVAKINRLRCSSHPMLRGNYQGERRRATTKPRVPLEPDAPPPVEPAAFKLDGRSITLDTIRYNMCHYPIGDPQAKDFCYCGNPAVTTYCDWHRSIMFQPKPKRGK